MKKRITPIQYLLRNKRQFLLLLGATALFLPGCGKPGWLTTEDGPVPPGFYLCKWAPGNDEHGFLDRASGRHYLLSATRKVTAEAFDTAWLRTTTYGVDPSLQIRFTEAGRKDFTRLTEQSRNGVIALVVNDAILFAAQVADPITGPELSIDAPVSTSVVKTLLDARHPAP